MKIYVGVPEMTDDDIAGDVVKVSQISKMDLLNKDRYGQTLPLDPRTDLINHSPTGFAWNYNGSGPAQLALGILCDRTDDDEALRFYHAFKDQVITKLGEGGFVITSRQVDNWIRKERANA